MQHSSHPDNPEPTAPATTHPVAGDPASGDPTFRYFRELADGGTLTIDDSTIPDPETGAPVPAATLRLPVWRMRDVSDALSSWTTTTQALALSADWPPDETDLSAALADGADVLDPPDVRDPATGTPRGRRR